MTKISSVRNLKKGLNQQTSSKVSSTKKKKKTSWLVTTIKQILKIPIQKFDIPVFSFKRTNKAAARNRKLLAVLN